MIGTMTLNSLIFRTDKEVRTRQKPILFGGDLINQVNLICGPMASWDVEKYGKAQGLPPMQGI